MEKTVRSSFIIKILSNFDISQRMKLNWKFLSHIIYIIIRFFSIVTPFLRIFILKGSANNGKNPCFCFPVIALINEEATSCINVEAIGAISESAIGTIVASRNPTPYFLFHVSLLQLHQKLVTWNFLVTGKF